MGRCVGGTGHADGGGDGRFTHRFQSGQAVLRHRRSIGDRVRGSGVERKAVEGRFGRRSEESGPIETPSSTSRSPSPFAASTRVRTGRRRSADAGFRYDVICKSRPDVPSARGFGPAHTRTAPFLP